jgi:hypothetical protein
MERKKSNDFPELLIFSEMEFRSPFQIFTHLLVMVFLKQLYPSQHSSSQILQELASSAILTMD